MVVPQGTEAILQDGQLASLAAGARSCVCDALDMKRDTTPAPPPPNAASRIPLTTADASTPALQPVEKKASPPPTPGEQPIWKIYAPPLTYDASGANAPSAPVKGGTMPPPAPETALLFREVYAEPMIIWRGVVEAAPLPTAPSVAAKGTPPQDLNAAVQPAKKPSLGTRVANFFRKMFGGKPKQEKPAEENQPQPAAARIPPAQAIYMAVYMTAYMPS
jgi:hypothetical protein